MTDEAAPAAEATPASPEAPETVTTEAVEVAHQAERDTRHGLAHLEQWFVEECENIAHHIGADASALKDEARTLLARLAGKL